MNTADGPADTPIETSEKPVEDGPPEYMEQDLVEIDCLDEDEDLEE